MDLTHSPSSRHVQNIDMRPIRLAGLFQKRIDGDDTLLRLARLRFAQAGLAAELYAGSPRELNHLLRFVADHPYPPVVHLHRKLNILDERSREEVTTYASQFAGRIAGLVVHDHAEMAHRTDELVASMQHISRSLEQRRRTPQVFLEYAAGLDLDWYIDSGERLRNTSNASLCLDIGHIGIRHSRQVFARQRPDVDVSTLRPGDPRLPIVVDDLQDAVRSALAIVLQTISVLGRLNKPLHFHLHDGHPIVSGLPDHRSFLAHLPVPFSYRGQLSLAPLYGPSGAREVTAHALAVCGVERASFTLEIHQTPGQLPLDDAATLFRHWPDLTNAERMNHWLSVLADNSKLVTANPIVRGIYNI